MYSIDLAASIPGSWGQAVSRKSRTLSIDQSRDSITFCQCLPKYGAWPQGTEHRTDGACTPVFLNSYIFMFVCSTVQVNFKPMISHLFLLKVSTFYLKKICEIKYIRHIMLCEGAENSEVFLFWVSTFCEMLFKVWRTVLVIKYKKGAEKTRNVQTFIIAGRCLLIVIPFKLLKTEEVGIVTHNLRWQSSAKWQSKNSNTGLPASSAHKFFSSR